MKLVNTFNEWDPLEEVIVGIADNANRPIKLKDQILIEFFGKDYSNIPSGRFPKKIIEEANEDLENLVDILKQNKVIVKRPKPTNHSKFFCTPNWCSDGFYNYAPRDLFLVVGDMIIESPMTLRSRYFEADAYKSIFLNYLQNGAKWISAPKPQLADSAYKYTDNEYEILNNIEPIFDGANIIRAGRDLFYLVSSTGNDLGYLWLKNLLGDTYNIHPIYNMYSSIHIDSTIAFLRPGLVLLNKSRVNEDNLPDALRKWDKIWFDDPVDIGYEGVHAYSSVWIAMNILMLNPNLAIVDAHQKTLINQLKKHKIEVIPLTFRHARTLGGGFHCVTLDIRRKGKLESYF